MPRRWRAQTRGLVRAGQGAMCAVLCGGGARKPACQPAQSRQLQWRPREPSHQAGCFARRPNSQPGLPLVALALHQARAAPEARSNRVRALRHHRCLGLVLAPVRLVAGRALLMMWRQGRAEAGLAHLIGALAGAAADQAALSAGLAAPVHLAMSQAALRLAARAGRRRCSPATPARAQGSQIKGETE